MTRRIPPIRVAAIVLGALALVLAAAAAGAPVNAFTAASDPAVVKPSTTYTYTIRLTNAADSPERAQRARIGIPTGFDVSPTMSATTSDTEACTASSWEPTPIVDGVVEFKKPGGGSTTELCPGGTLTITISASAPTEGVWTWTTELLRDTPFALQGAQPTVRVDGTPPVASIDGSPADPSNDSSPSFTFSADEQGAAFECKLDAGEFVACESPITYQGLAPGAHIFTVNATDQAGNRGGNATYSWTIVAPPSPPPPPPTPPPPAPPAPAPPVAPDVVPPHEVANVRAKAANATVTLTWMLPADPDFDRVSVTRIAPGKGIRAMTVYQGRKTSLTDRRLKNGVRYRYRIATRDTAGNISAGLEVAATPQAPLITPVNGASLTAPPLLRWQAARKATYYNVQLWLVETSGQAKAARPVKVLSAWPAGQRLQLTSRWTFRGKAYGLVPGRYRWYVWPGLGKRSARKYGPMLGESIFTIRAKKAVLQKKR